MAGIEKVFFSSEGVLVAMYRNSQIEKDFDTFCSIVKKNFPDANIEKDHDLATIRVPSKFNDFSDNPQLSEEDNIQLDLMFNTLDEYETSEVEKKVNSMEIIPLDGYLLKNMIEDAKNAVHEKLNICIIDSYDNYQKYNSGNLIEINHVNLDYLSDNYCNAVIDIINGDIDNLKKVFEPLLKKAPMGIEDD